MSGNLERRYRRVLRLLPCWYRQQWEDDMLAAFLDSWLTGDPEVDGPVLEFCKPDWAEVASVAGLAVRLYLGGAGTPRRSFAWGQAVRNAVLALMLMHAVVAVNALVFSSWGRRLLGFPALPVSIGTASAGDIWHAMWYLVNFAWIVVFATLTRERYRTARVIATLAIVPGLVALLRVQLAGTLALPFGNWAFWSLLSLLPVLAMAAFHRDAPPPARGRWLLSLPAGYLLVYMPLLALQTTGNSAWLPDFSGLCCIVVSVACLVHIPLIRLRRGAGTGVWSLTLVVLAAVAGAYRLASLGDYVHDPHLIAVSLAETLILLLAVALVAPDAARAQAATSARPPYPRPMTA
jgi:hypothetical protein